MGEGIRERKSEEKRSKKYIRKSVQRKKKQTVAIMLAFVFSIPAFYGNGMEVQAGNCGGHIVDYTCPGHSQGHNMSAYSTCSGCGGDGTVNERWHCRACGYECTQSYANNKCPRCNSNEALVYKKDTCSRCSGHGKNRHCTNGTNCAYSSWGYHASVSGTCYISYDNCTPVYGDHVAAGAATCTSPSLCMYCSEILENPLGHAASGWQFDIPGYHRQVCTRCGAELLREANTYQVVYNANGAYGSIETQSATYDQGFYLAANAFWRPGYTFENYCYQGVGWFNSGQYVSNLTTGHGATVTMDAQWKANQYIVSFHANGGSVSPASKTVTYNSSYGNLPTPVKSGYDFTGWYNAPSDYVSTPQNHQVIYKGVDYSAVYNFDYYCNTYLDVKNAFGNNPQAALEHFVTNGMKEGRRASENFDLNYYRSNNKDLQNAFGSNNQAYYEHYMAFGQYESRKAAAATGISSGSRVTTPSAHTLYAHWQVRTYNVAYHANGGEKVSKTADKVQYGKAVDLSPTAEKDGYIFIGWSTEPDGTRGLESLTMSDIGANGSTLHLYALYSIPVSDVKELYIQSWKESASENYKITPLKKTGNSIRGYYYKLDTTNVVSGLSGSGKTGCRLLAWDNASNWQEIKRWNSSGNPPVPEWYVQTVNHFKYNRVLERWVRFETTSETVLKGETYVPRYITEPEGYKKDHIDGSYVVEGDKTSSAYYSPCSYTLYFNSNGGNCNVKEKTIYYNDSYGDMPTPTWEGHTFLGWFTSPTEGEQKISSDIYTIAGNSILYAHWQTNQYKVFYDYQTNGGVSAEKEFMEAEYGTAVNLKVSAVKNDWEHIGWNTDPDAEEGLKSLTMGTENITLYAIYRKTVHAYFIDQSDAGIQKRETSVTIYNRMEKGGITILKQHDWSGWEKQGWSLKKEADAQADAGEGAKYYIDKNVNFYGLYQKDIYVSYDLEYSDIELPIQTDIRYYNASGNYKNPLFVLAEAPIRQLHSFVSWVDENGIEYSASSEVVLERDMKYTARWDKYPEIEAYDRYFTLEQAQNGEITTVRLLEKVTGTDLEDGVLENGTAVIVKDYNPEEFTMFSGDGSLTIIYQATDSFGNKTEKLVTVHIVDSSMQDNAEKKYLRFISNKVYKENGDYVEAEKGGLEAASKWKTNEAYAAALNYVMENEKTDTESVTAEMFGKIYEVVRPGSGTWNHKRESWSFTREEIEQIKAFIKENGYARYQNKNATEQFYENFAQCREEELEKK